LFEGGSWNGRERNFAYLNLGGLRFSEASAALGVDFLDDARLVAPMDWDDDGRVDLWLRNRTGPRLRFLRNVQESAGHSIAIDLACPEKNRDAIGARVTVHAGGSRSTSTVYAAQGFMAAPSRRLHFGLGAATKAERVEIRWPDGGTDSFSDVPADARYRIVQGTGKIERVPRRPHPALGGQAGDPVRVPPGEMSRIVLYERLPAAAVDLPSTAQPDRTVGNFSGKPLLAVLVRAGDPASEHALKVLAGKHKVFEALCVPRVVLVEGDGDAAADAAAGELVARLGFADLAGAASRRFLRTLQVFLVEILGPFDRLPYPLALLFDGAGALTVVYTGALPFDAIASDAASTRDLDPKTSSTEPLLGGRWAQAYSRNLEGVAQIFDVLGEVDLGRTYHRLAAARAGR
jgi:hypothetical protein